MSALELKEEFINLSKRILKTRLPQPATTYANFKEIIEKYNQIIRKCKLINSIQEGTPEAKTALNVFKKCRKTLIKVCQKLDTLLRIPTTLDEKVSISVLKDPNESYTTPTESDLDSEFFETESEQSDHNSEEFHYNPELFFREASPFLTRTPSPISQHNTPPYKNGS